MPNITIKLSELDTERLRYIAARSATTPEEALLEHVQEWLATVASQVREREPQGELPEGHFQGDGYTFSFFDPAKEDPSRAEDYLTPEQRMDAIAEILATIALRAVAKEREQKTASELGEQQEGGASAETEAESPGTSKTAKGRGRRKKRLGELEQTGE